MKVVAAFRIGQMHNDTAEEAQQINPLFAIVQAGILLRGYRVIKNRIASCKIQTVFADVALPFIFIPSNHEQIVLTDAQHVKQIVNTITPVLRGTHLCLTHFVDKKRFSG